MHSKHLDTKIPFLHSSGRFRASMLRGLQLVKVRLFSDSDYQRSVAQTLKGAQMSQPGMG